jgi:hypothetical protein
MPDEPQGEETIETETVKVGKATKLTPARAGAVAAGMPQPNRKEMLDERQKAIGDKRKPAGPPTAATAAMKKEAPPSDVPPTDCDDSQSD